MYTTHDHHLVTADLEQRRTAAAQRRLARDARRAVATTPATGWSARLLVAELAVANRTEIATWVVRRSAAAPGG